MERVSNLFMHLLWGLLMVLAVVLYKERLFADASYYLFHAVNSEWFHVEHGRTVLALSQLSPLIGTWLGLPLQWVLVLASLGHELFYYSLFLLCLYPLKDRFSAIALLAVHVIGQLYLYYSPMLEICYGAALAVLFYAILRKHMGLDWKWPLFMFVVQWFALMSHPENFVLIGLAIAYDLFKRKTCSRTHIAAIALSMFAFAFELLTLSEYEKGHSNLFSDERPATAFNLLESEYLVNVLSLFREFYPDLILLGFLSLLVLVRSKRWIHLGLFSASVIFLLVLVNQAQVADQFSRYRESMYNPMVYIVVFFFVNEVLRPPHIRFREFGFLALVLLCGFRVFWTYEFGEQMRMRSEKMEVLIDGLQEQNTGRFELNAKNLPAPNWALPIEALFYSAIDGPDRTISLVSNVDLDFNRNREVIGEEEYLFRRFEIKPTTGLNEKYFQIQAGEYEPMNGRGVDKVTELGIKDAIRIELIGSQLYSAGDSSHVLVAIHNQSSDKLPTHVEEQIFLSYHWQSEDGGDYEWDGLRTPIQRDVQGQVRQLMDVKFPTSPGHYRLIPDLVVEGKYWFGLSEGFPIHVK